MKKISGLGVQSSSSYIMELLSYIKLTPTWLCLLNDSKDFERRENDNVKKSQHVFSFFFSPYGCKMLIY